MRIVMYLVIVASMLATYISSPLVGLAPGFVKFVPDLLSVATMLYVVAAGTRRRFQHVGFKYWLILGSLAFVLACGPLVNHEPPGALVTGMRYYLRAVPFFLLPAVVDFTEEDLKRYMRLLLALALLQSPIAVYQRFRLAAHNQFSGDMVFGTLNLSGTLTLFLISVLCVMGALMLRGRIGKIWYGMCFVGLMIPMSINETKVTVFLLPMGLLATFALASPPGKRILVTLSALGLLAVGGVIFVPLYNYYNTLHNPVPFTIQDFFSNKASISGYLTADAGNGITEQKGRADAIIEPFKAFGHDPVKLTFGLGMGNASKSSLGPQFSGVYQAHFWDYAQTLSISAFLFELGVFGTVLVLFLHFMLLRDALFIGRNDPGLLGAIAPGYVGAWVTVTVGLFYENLHPQESISYMFFFFSGLLAARQTQLRLAVSGARRTQYSNVQVERSAVGAGVASR